MKDRTPAQRRARTMRRIGLSAFAVGLLGALFVIAAVAAGANPDGPVATAGAVVVVGALGVMFVAVPIGIWFNVQAMRDRWRELTGRDHDRPA